MERYGEASEKFVAAILRSKIRQAEWATKKAAEAAEAKPVIEGKLTITGEVVSVKWKENAYGGRLVMTVKDDRGFKVWGTVPASIQSVASLTDPTDFRQLDRGDRVAFKATVTKSDTDETFGFFKRPTEAVVLTTTQEV